MLVELHRVIYLLSDNFSLAHRMQLCICEKLVSTQGKSLFGIVIHIRILRTAVVGLVYAEEDQYGIHFK